MACVYLLLQGSQIAVSKTDTGVLSIPTVNPPPYQALPTIIRASYITALTYGHHHSLSAGTHMEIRRYDFTRSWKKFDIRHGPVSTKLEYLAAPLYNPQLRHLKTPINLKMLTAGLLFYLKDKFDGNL